MGGFVRPSIHPSVCPSIHPSIPPSRVSREYKEIHVDSREFMKIRNILKLMAGCRPCFYHSLQLFLCKNTYIMTRGYFSRCFISTLAWLIYLSILSSIQTQFFRMNSDQIVGREISNVLQKILDSKIL